MAYVAYLEDEKIKISRGMVKGASFVHKFGAVPSMATNTTGTVWDKNDTIYPWASWATSANVDRKSTRLNSSHSQQSRMPSSA